MALRPNNRAVTGQSCCCVLLVLVCAGFLFAISHSIKLRTVCKAGLEAYKANFSLVTMGMHVGELKNCQSSKPKISIDERFVILSKNLCRVNIHVIKFPGGQNALYIVPSTTAITSVKFPGGEPLCSSNFSICGRPSDDGRRRTVVLVFHSQSDRLSVAVGFNSNIVIPRDQPNIGPLLLSELFFGGIKRPLCEVVGALGFISVSDQCKEGQNLKYRLPPLKAVLALLFGFLFFGWGWCWWKGLYHHPDGALGYTLATMSCVCGLSFWWWGLSRWSASL